MARTPDSDTSNTDAAEAPQRSPRRRVSAVQKPAPKSAASAVSATSPTGVDLSEPGAAPARGRAKAEKAPKANKRPD